MEKIPSNGLSVRQRQFIVLRFAASRLCFSEFHANRKSKGDLLQVMNKKEKTEKER